MLKSIGKRQLIPLLAAVVLGGCSETWNSPHPRADSGEIVYQTNFQLPPKNLDPAVAYSSDEGLIIDQIYEPPLGYHFLKRPYELIPQTLEEMPEIQYLNEQKMAVQEDSSDIAYTSYVFTLKKGTLYQPHPAFSKTEDGSYHYLFKTPEESLEYTEISDFPSTDTRELTADDYIYQIKRVADPVNKSPLLAFLSKYIVGMSKLSQELRQTPRNGWLDLRPFDISGVKKISRYQYSITIKGVYPQFIYWQAMRFFSPIPWEADRFYKNPGFAEKNLTLSWYPIGTGAFMLTRNNPNQEIILERNPNYHDDFYPSEGTPEDREAGLLADAGKKLPMIDKAVYTLDKEVMPMWGKFLQGYYDRSGENHGNVTQNFDQALVVGPQSFELSEEMAGKAITLSEAVTPGIYYNGFNMLDPVVGGYGEKQKKLRQAIAIAWNMEEFIDIFVNGAGLPYMGPIPPGIDGAGEGINHYNPYTHNWVDGKAVRKSIEDARQLMVEAGYPDGRDSETGKPLKLFYDVQSQASSNSTRDWQKRQLEKLGIQLEFRSSDWNRYKEKMRTGNHQIFTYGWLADYPDPENFLFLFYSQESPVLCQCNGSNNSNYSNPEFDRLFEQMRTMQPGPERSELIARMLEIIRRDVPWFTGYYKKDFYLNNPWIFNNKRHGISYANLKYIRIDTDMRKEKQREWNHPNIWPLILLLLAVAGLFTAAITAYQKRQKLTINQDNKQDNKEA